MRKKAVSFLFAAVLAGAALGLTGPGASATCRSTTGGSAAAGPLAGGSPTTYGFIGISAGGGNYIELNGGQTTDPGVQLEGKVNGSGAFVNSDGAAGAC